MEQPCRRKLFDLAQLARAPLAAEAVRRIDAILGAERIINGLLPEQRLAVRQAHVAQLVAELESWMRAARAKMSRHADVDPRAWLTNVLRRIADHPGSRLHEVLPWNWRTSVQDTAAAA